MRPALPREFYIPKSYTERRSPLAANVVAYVGSSDRGFYAMGFIDARAKPAFHFRYPTAERMESCLAKWFEEQASRNEHVAKMKAERKAARARPHNFKPGTILRASWGYDQTNIDYYQVTRVIGQHMVEIREIGKASNEETGFMTGTCTPQPDAFIGEPERRRADAAGYIKLESYKYAYPWKGEPDRWSSYA